MLGLESWLANFTQFVWEAQTEQSLADIPRPLAEYCIYGTFKTTQVAAAIGASKGLHFYNTVVAHSIDSGLIVHPLYRLYRLRQLRPETSTPNSTKIIRNQCRRIQGRFVIAGLVVGPVLTCAYAAMEGLSEHELRTRCYAIRVDKNGLHRDRCTVAFFLIGWYWRRFQGACDGCNLGLVYSLFSQHVLTPYTNRVLKDKPIAVYGGYEEGVKRKTKLTAFLIERGILPAPGKDGSE